MQINASQLGGPSKEGPADFYYSLKVRNFIFNNEVPKSEVITVRNFIYNNEILNSGNQIPCPKNTSRNFVSERAIVNFHIELL